MRPHEIFAAMPPEQSETFFARLAEESPLTFTQALAGAAAAMNSRPQYLLKQPMAKRVAAVRRALSRVAAKSLAEEILAVDGVDACWVGPSDLAKSMGVDPSTPEGAEARDAAILSVLEACRKTGKIPGIAAIGDAKRWIEQGFLFVTAGYDAWFMVNAAQETLRSHGRL